MCKLGETADSISSRLTLPKLHLATFKKSTACEQALHLWRPKQAATERARELLSRDFSRLPQRIAYLQAEKLESTLKRTFLFF